MILKKYDLSKQANLSEFLRKIILTGHVINLDLTPIDEIASLLRICSNNINQIAKRMNSYEYVGKSDIKYLKDLHNKLWDLIIELSSKADDL